MTLNLVFTSYMIRKNQMIWHTDHIRLWFIHHWSSNSVLKPFVENIRLQSLHHKRLCGYAEDWAQLYTQSQWLVG